MQSPATPPDLPTNIRKSPNDPLSYYASALPNGLKYLLVSDPEADKSAASLDILVGSSNEPTGTPGLAHCLEHLLFLGTEKYPDTSGFDNFLNKSNGGSNAYTEFCSTNFQFEVSNEGFQKALDMFSQFYVSPLFDASTVDKELNAIDSEFKIAERNDSRRLDFLKVFEGYKDSSFNRFNWGNLSTLKKDGIRSEVIAFYKRHYDPKLMSVCVYSKLSLRELDDLVKENFGKIKYNGDGEDRKIVEKPLYDEGNLGYMYNVKTVKDIKTLEFYWVINESYRQFYKADPFTFISTVLGQEEENSLTSYLKRSDLIFSLGSSHYFKKELYTEFEISLTLTDNGLKNYKEIIVIILSYIELLKHLAVNEMFFHDLKQTLYVDFLNFEKVEPVDYVETLSETLNKIKCPQDILTSLSLIEEYDPNLIKRALNQISLRNLNIYLCKQAFDTDKEWQTVPYFNVEYQKSRLENYELLSYDKLSELKLGYPSKNIYIPRNLSLIEVSEELLKAYKTPQKVKDTPLSIVWYKPDVKFKLPKVYIGGNVYISHQNVDYNLSLVYDDIIKSLMNIELTEIVAKGDFTSISVAFKFLLSGINFEADGWSDTIKTYLRDYFKELKKVFAIEKIDNVITKLLSILEKLIRNTKNYNLSPAEKQTKSSFNRLALDPHMNSEVLLRHYERMKSIIETTQKVPDELTKYVNNMFNKFKFEWLVEGSIALEDALELTNNIEKSFLNLPADSKPISEDSKYYELSVNEIRKRKVVNLENPSAKPKIYRKFFKSADPENKNNSLLSYFQVGKVNNDDVLSCVLMKMIDTVFCQDIYDELRTKLQVGYDVSISQQNLFDVKGFKVFIQSNKYAPSVLSEKLNKFFLDFDLNDPENFSDEDYNDYKKSVLDNLKVKDITLEEQFRRDANQVYDRKYDFERVEKLIKCLENEVTKEKVIAFFNAHIYKSARRLETGVVWSVENAEENAKMDVEEDKKNSAILPSAKDAEIISVENDGDFACSVNYYPEMY